MSSKLYALLSPVPGSIRVLSKTNNQKGGGRKVSYNLEIRRTYTLTAAGYDVIRLQVVQFVVVFG